MPWLFTLTDLTTSPAGSFGMSMVYDWPDAEPRIEARPVAPFSETTILLGPDSCDGPGHAAGDAQVGRDRVRPFRRVRAERDAAYAAAGVATEENGRTAWPLMLSTVALALLDRLLRCTPVALAVKLNATLLPLAVSLFALMSMILMSLAASWVRNGQPSMLTDGLALSPDDWIFWAIVVLRDRLGDLVTDAEDGQDQHDQDGEHDRPALAPPAARRRCRGLLPVRPRLVVRPRPVAVVRLAVSP